MRLSAGTKLGPYEILAPLGAGGMGEVYRARDSNLDREVAFKVLPESLSQDADRMARFEREARLLAALNHPNIAAIYAVESAGLVMELVEGPTLAQRIQRGAIPAREALSIAKQIADALEAAHQKNIIHRDLKPANIKITPSGTVKVLDFGLAKAAAPEAFSAPDTSPTLTLSATRAGMILGTVVYMAPEQALGKSVDKRADIWSFGCVLYEMLCGKRAFDGKSTTEILAAVLKSEPDWKTLPCDTPPNVLSLLRHCLAKEPANRVHDIADARLELLEQRAAEPGVLPRRAKGWWVALATCTALAFVAGSWWRSPRGPLELHWSGERLGGSAVAMGPRLSPDGQLLAFQAMVNGITQVAVLKPTSGNWAVLTHDEKTGFVGDICWSRDGAKLYYNRVGNVSGGVYSVPLLGGEERLVMENAGHVQLGSDGSLLFARQNAERRFQLHRYWPETGRLQPLKALLLKSGKQNFRLTPTGDRVVFLGEHPDRPSERAHLYALDLNTEQITRLAPDQLIAANFPFALAVTGDGRSALFVSTAADLQRVVSIPMDGSPGMRTLFSMTNIVGFLDAGSDGSIYSDVWERPGQIIRVAPSSGAVEQIGSGQTDVTVPEAISLQDGRVVFATRAAGRERLLVAGAGKDPAPLIETEEETTPPATPVGTDEVAFMMGAPHNQIIAVATITGGRVVRRLESTRGKSIDSMTTLPDGKMIFFTAQGSVWSVPAVGGEPHKLGAGDSVTADPSRSELIARLDGFDSATLVRMSPSGADLGPIRVAGGDIRLAPGDPLNPRAVYPDGRILVTVATGMFTWPAGILEPRTGHIQLVQLGYPADLQSPGWSPDGKVVTLAAPIRSTLWRFRPN